MHNPKTAALDFEEFSYVNDQGTFRRIDAAWLDILSEYLEKYYQAQSISERLPYLVVWCKDTVPPPSERPFMIAGLVAVWLVQGKDKYPQDMDLGDMGRSSDKHWISLEQNLLADLKVFVIPKAKTLSSPKILLRNGSAVGLRGGLVPAFVIFIWFFAAVIQA